MWGRGDEEGKVNNVEFMKSIHTQTHAHTLNKIKLIIIMFCPTGEEQRPL